MDDSFVGGENYKVNEIRAQVKETHQWEKDRSSIFISAIEVKKRVFKAVLATVVGPNEKAGFEKRVESFYGVKGDDDGGYEEQM